MSKADVKKSLNKPLLRDLYKIRFFISDKEDMQTQLEERAEFNPDEINFLITRYEQIVSVDDMRARYTIELAGLYLDFADQKKLVSKLSGWISQMSQELPHMKGSSSMKDKFESQAVDNIAPKGARKTKRVRSVKKRSSGIAITRNDRKKASNKPMTPLRILKEVNSALPSVVAGNMGSPRLNYKTGRFASSARLEDVKETDKGYWSLGVTYQRSPYQVFESGGRGRMPWNIYNRDPRDLLELSVRQIAKELALGRIYVRSI